MNRTIPALLLFVGCQGNGSLTVIDTDPPTILQGQTGASGPVYGTGPPTGICGDVTYVDLTVFGAVEYPDGSAARNVEVDLEDRGWIAGTLMGSTTTDSDGLFEMTVLQLASVEDCWGTVLNYVLVAETDDAFAERPANSVLYNSILDESLTADFRDVPLVLE